MHYLLVSYPINHYFLMVFGIQSMLMHQTNQRMFSIESWLLARGMVSVKNKLKLNWIFFHKKWNLTSDFGYFDSNGSLSAQQFKSHKAQNIANEIIKLMNWYWAQESVILWSLRKFLARNSVRTLGILKITKNIQNKKIKPDVLRPYFLLRNKRTPLSTCLTKIQNK